MVMKLINERLVLHLYCVSVAISLSWKEKDNHPWQRKQMEIMWREALSHLISQHLSEMCKFIIVRSYEKVEVQRGKGNRWKEPNWGALKPGLNPGKLLPEWMTLITILWSTGFVVMQEIGGLGDKAVKIAGWKSLDTLIRQLVIFIIRKKHRFGS